MFLFPNIDLIHLGSFIYLQSSHIDLSLTNKKKFMKYLDPYDYYVNTYFSEIYYKYYGLCLIVFSITVDPITSYENSYCIYFY